MSLAPGTRLGRYEVHSRIGAGGMGEVYLALDPTLDRRVALKILPAAVAADPDRIERFVQEAKAASALNHPNIITIYEIEQTGSVQFIATEFIDGETLRQRMRDRPMNLLEVLDVATQTAGALVAAHAAGIVHRDIKPDNIMLRGDGLVKLLDFGLAKLAEPSTQDSSDTQAATLAAMRTEPGRVMGTALYMSPEQARGLTVDARTDVFSCGVVLYEMVAGRLPFEGGNANERMASLLSDNEPPPLARHAPEVPVEFERIVSKALRKDRDERYQTTKDLLLDVKTLKQQFELERHLQRTDPLRVAARTSQAAEPAARSLPSRPVSSVDIVSADRLVSARVSGLGAMVNGLKRHKVGATITLAVLLVASVALLVYLKRQSPLTVKDTILLADFVNTTGDATFDGSTLKQALAVQLRQTPFVNLFPEEGVRETLRYMGRPEDERITKQIAREICARRGLKALISGSIASLGRNYAITLEAINGQTGDTIASQQIETETKEQVLRSLGQAALEMRRQLGESLSTLQKYNAPIEQATTSSLEALNAYSKGLEQIYSGKYLEALPLFNRAVELDPAFAEAYVWLAWTYANFAAADPGASATFARKAYALRDRVTELEKLRIDDIYHLWATGDFDKQKEADEVIARLYPGDWVPHNSLAISYNAIGRLDSGVAEAREGIRVNPNEVHLYWQLSGALIRLNRFDEAREAIRQGQARKLDHTVFRSFLYLIAVVNGDAAEIQRQLDLLRTQDGAATALGAEARRALFEGRWRDAQTLYRRAAEFSTQTGAAARPAPLPALGAMAGALFGFCPASDDRAAVASLSSPRTILFQPIRSDGSPCGEVGEMQRLAEEQARRYPASISVKAFSGPIVRALIALRRSQPDQALEDLKAAVPYEGGSGLFWPSYLRGEAYVRLRRGPEAAAEFRRILDHRGWDPLSPMYPLAHLGLAQALSLSGDVAGSRKSYEDLLTMWKNADADLPVLVQAKKEYERLRP